ncbi:MAG TPA: ABC transporter ATP-binding protein [Candidatus Cybelea sp.]|jgi:lipopolysaccharide transport system ATP-binding protein|nr:ABC transporter ATP-binding protein [Candidatus Cybelea sp.]
MSEAIISVENLGKHYRISHEVQRPRYTALRDVVAERAAGIGRRLWSFARLSRRRSSATSAQQSSEDFWAIKDVSFEVKQGEVVGIVGRNGAGKSTLLKILSRITEPTFGRVCLRGRVASLLEVGTGFHPELTGRENVFLNGAILGMSRVEIKKKFDEIVAFAEVEKFLDTPVKRYSSGMYVRLAFAVAAHLEPEILIVDEVLAVGDVEFQKKCLGKMEAVSQREGRTVLFVSHQIMAVTRLCQSALWLDRGRVQEFGPAHHICSRYLANGSEALARRQWDASGPGPGNEWVRLECVEALADGKPADNVDIKSPLHLCLNYRVLKGGKVLIPNVHLFSDVGTLIFILHDWHSGWRTKAKPPGLYRTVFTVPGNVFSEGRITMKVVISTYQPYEVHFEQPDAIGFTVVEATEGLTARGDYTGHIPGAVRPLFESRTERIEADPPPAERANRTLSCPA